jgi:hypothetical protein
VTQELLNGFHIFSVFADFAPEEYFIILPYDVLDEAIAAAKADTEETMLLIANRKPTPSKHMSR